LVTKLVATRVATLDPGTYTDPGQTGLQLRVLAKKAGYSRTWLLRFKFRGEETRIALGHFPATSLDTARGLARKYRELASQGIDPRKARPSLTRLSAPGLPGVATAPTDGHSIEFLAHEFLELHVRPSRKRPEYAERIIKNDVLPKWKGRDARTIKPREVIELLDGIVERGSKVMANRVAGLLGQMFKFGIHRSIVESSPVQLLYRPGGKEKSKVRALSDPELRALLTNMDDVFRAPRTACVLRILLLTAQRRSEVTLARWHEIDFTARTWHIPDENAKGNRGHVVPLTDWAVREFKRLKKRAGRSRFVFPNDEGNEPADPKLVTRSVARCLDALKEHGINAFTPHDLRRTVRTGLARLKVEPHIAERVLNHKQETIPGTYDVHDYLEEKRTALDRWASHLETLNGKV
jgi:integrase